MKKLLLSVLFAVALPASAEVNVKDAWARATVPGQQASGAFMELTAARDASLVDARSPAAAQVEIHEMSLRDNVMKMRQIPAIVLPAGKTVSLKPGGYHLMLLDLHKPVKEGDVVPVTLVIEYADKKRESIEVKVPVRSLTGAAPAKHSGHHKH